MDCGRFNKLIDSYLDGQLAGSLLAEFHAHRLACRRCSRVISMLQAAGDVIATDRGGEPKISADFADRIVLALPTVTQKANRSLWMVRLTAGAATLAAAAAIVMAAMLSTQVTNMPGEGSSTAERRSPIAIHRTVVAPIQVIAHDWDRKIPANAVDLVHRQQPSESDLLTGSAVRGAVDRVVGWTEYRLQGKDQAE